MTFTRKLITAALSIAAICLTLSTVAEAQSKEPSGEITKVKAIAVKKTVLTKYVTTSGNLTARQRSLLSFNVPGIIEDVLVDTGDVVKENQELARIDAINYRLYLAQAEAALKAAQATREKFVSGFREEEVNAAEAAVSAAQAAFDQADKEYQRMKNLLEAGTVAQARFDASEAQWKAAKAHLDQAKEQLAMVKTGYRKEDVEAAQAQAELQKAALDLAKQKVVETVLRAPYAGVITGKFLDKGSKAEGPVFEIMDISELTAELPVPDIYALKITSGSEALIDVDGGPKGIKSAVKTASHKIDTRTMTFTVKVPIQNSDLQLKAGMFVRAKLAADILDGVISLPEKAIVERDGKKMVFVVADGKAVLREVTTGISSEGAVEIVSGLKEGESIIIEGNFGLNDGSAVEIGGER
jgi:multidrug efflux pump subunit AcrA (membrane-fusion protein)